MTIILNQNHKQLPEASLTFLSINVKFLTILPPVLSKPAMRPSSWLLEVEAVLDHG